MKKIIPILLIALLAAAMIGCSSAQTAEPVVLASDSSAAADTDSSVSSTQNETSIVLDGSEAQIDGTGAQADGAVVTVSSGGTYRLSGETTDGSITVDAAGEEVVLVLSGVSIKNSSGPAVLIKEAETAIVTLADGTVNTLEDAGESDYDGALYGCVSYTINGNGTLNVNGTMEEGIASEMHLTIESGIINIASSDDGINANNDGISEIIINGGTLFIDSGGDGIDSNGSIEINGGEIVTFGSINDANGGLDADSGVAINGGTVFAAGANITLPAGSGQNFLAMNIEGQTGDTLSISADGTELFSTELTQACQTILFTSPDIADGVSYDVSLDGESQGSVTAEDSVSRQMGSPGGGGMRANQAG